LLKENVYRQLKGRGRFGESFSDVVERLLDETKGVGRNE